MTNDPYIVIPRFDADTQLWDHQVFDTRGALTAFITDLFKEPGQYGFDESAVLFNAQARYFKQHGYYCNAPFKSRDYVHYWDEQKERNLKGVIYTHAGRTWYLTREYYMWLNFLPIYHKEKKKYDFPDVRDVQYHLSLYEYLAELSYKHAVILKKRQIASSYFHAGKLINGFWFNEGYVGKIGASLKDYINEKGTWIFLNEYANFLDTHTAWYRPRNPSKVFAWYQEIEVSAGGRKQKRGLKSRLSGMSFEKDPTNGVGGPCVHFFHEEAGIAPKMNNTYEYVRPALQDGQIATGLFIAAGSVGDLDQCQPLKTYLLRPEENGFLGIETDLLDNKGTRAVCGLFLPEQWGMPPFIDGYGNSLVAEALDAIITERKQWEKDLEPDQYQLRISQKPTNISEAFALRKASKFPVHLLQQQLRRIQEKEYPYEILELERNTEGKIEVKDSRRAPISEFPLPKNFPHKEGALTVWERPLEKVPWGTYYASIDPVSEGKTSTSDSLCSIFVYKNPIEVTSLKKDGSSEIRIEGGRVVASWCGRYEDINDTHNLLELVIEWFNAWTIVEVNVSLFIQHMISKRKQKFLVPKDQIVFLKEIGANRYSHQDYGWKNTGSFFKEHLLNYAIEFCKEVIDQEFDPDGNVVQTHYGVERIMDAMLLTEMAQYQEGLNVDRLVAFTALVAFVKVQVANRGYRKLVEDGKNPLASPKDLYKLKLSPFRSIRRSSFRNLH
jgi:hypothetical protein